MNDSNNSSILIVDNSDDNWKAMRYLEQWAEISTKFDIATAFFEIGSLLALDGKWQSLDKIRILMGEEVTLRTNNAFKEALKKKTRQLDESIEAEKEKNDFLKGVDAIVDAIASGKIECRVYRRDKFHAKAYITHAKNEVIGSAALVGSSNFTFPGLTTNIELNVQLRHEVKELQQWYERHWNDAEEVSTEILSVIQRHIQNYSPFEIYVRSLQEYYRGHDETAEEWEEKGPENNGSIMFPILDQYQKDGYRSLIQIRNKYRGAFLCDGVGLGKTFMGLMIIERLLFERKKVILLVPKSARKDVWESHLKQYLPSAFGGFTVLKIFNHTDLGRKGEFPDEFKKMAEQADAIVIDEAHNFRNRGTSGTGKREKSRYWLLQDLIGKKECFLLTATPINNRLSDFRHLIELFTGGQGDYFSSRLGINSLLSYFIRLEQECRQVGENDQEQTETDLVQAQEHLSMNTLFKELVVQRSRRYVRESQKLQSNNVALFPNKEKPQVADYSVKKTYGNLLDIMEKAFDRETPLFELSLYYPMGYLLNEPPVQSDNARENMERAFDKERQKQVVGLIRIQFLKRFESSIEAFTRSCDRLLLKMLSFIAKHSFNESEKERFKDWQSDNQKLIDIVKSRQQEFSSEDEQEEDLITPEMIEAVEELSPDEYDLDTIVGNTYKDLDQLKLLLNEVSGFNPDQDDKLKSLVTLLKTDPVMKEHKVLIFTEYAETARYLKKHLEKAGISGLDSIDGGTTKDRSDVVQRFAPYYNGHSSGELSENDRKEIRVLISTDVLSEGLNLQDATRLINYDIHWNPVRLMQRIGRVDRRMNPDIEAKILADHPERKEIRGKIAFWNFLPPDDLETLLRLFNKVAGKTLRISKALGIEGRRLLTPEDDFDALKDFNEKYEGDKTLVEEMNLELQRHLKEDPELEGRLNALPGRAFSGKENTETNSRAVFFCYRIPGPPGKTDDEQTSEWTDEAGKTEWYLYQIDDDPDNESILHKPEEIIDFIRCTKDTPRKCAIERETLRDVRLKIEKYIHNTTLRSMQAPIGVRPILKAWMEIN
jgi:SNF2 family DNA or RNA helicase